MAYKITSEDPLVLRDGRPFGDAGMFGGNALIWPFPQTIAGMVRTTIGYQQSKTYFQENNNCDKLLNIGIQHLLPMLKTNDHWQFILPPPADLVLTQKPGQQDYTVNPLCYECIADNAGTDIANRQWLLPNIDLRDKPAKETPFFLHWSFYEDYLQGNITSATNYSFSDLGIEPPIRDFRIHNTIDRKTLVTEESKLFANHGLYLKTKHEKQINDLAIHFTINHYDKDLATANDAYLGGERKRVTISQSAIQFPTCPKYFDNKQYLKLVLTTHGDFDGWCPEWLQPDLTIDHIDWVKLPNSTLHVRLRSAVVTGWDAVSGWDYQTKKPKAMKKLVRPGSIYIIELQQPADAQAIAEYFWGNNLNLDNQTATNNGYGQCIVGNTNINVTE